MHSKWNPSRREQRARDIVGAIERIKRYVADLQSDAFLGDDLRQDAVARQVLVIAEACDTIDEIERNEMIAESEKLAALEPSIPWRAISDMGIRIRHVYGTVDPEFLWAVAVDGDLDDLQSALLRAFPTIAKER